MSATVSFSSTGSLVTTGYYADSNPINDNRQTKFRVVTRVTVVNGETVTINHADDYFGLRDVRVINSSGVEVTHTTATVVSVTRTDSNTTTIVFGADDAGTYTIIIEY